MILFVVSVVTFSIIAMVATVFLALWTYKDAQVKSEQEPIMWLLIVLLLQGIGIIIYLCAGRTKKVPAPGTYKIPLIASLIALSFATVWFIFSTITFATGDLSSNSTFNTGVWSVRQASYRDNQWTETVRSGRGSSRRTHTLNSDQMRAFHVESTIQDGALYLLLEQGDTSTRIDISGDFYSRIDLHDHGFTPGRIRMTLQYERVYRSHTIINWRAQ